MRRSGQKVVRGRKSILGMCEEELGDLTSAFLDAVFSGGFPRGGPPLPGGLPALGGPPFPGGPKLS
jgi:hypothetical protein